MISALTVLSFAAIALILFIIYNENSGHKFKYPQAASQANASLLDEAFRTGSDSECDKISGGINEREGAGAINLPGGVIADSFGYPEMTENEAKEECRDIANRK